MPPTPRSPTHADAPEALPARDAYRLWAASYDETVVSALDDRIVRELSPSPVGRRLLDAGCGTGRRLPSASEGGRAVGIDLVHAMIAAGATAGSEAERVGAGAAVTREAGGRLLAAADVRALPFRAGSFDLLWCRLVLGHLPELAGAYHELARVAEPGATLIVSDFHPAAHAAGHARTFRDAAGQRRAVEDWAHSAADHERAAAAAGWTLESTVDAPAGAPERPFYERAGRLEQLERERALPLVLAACFRR